MLVGPLSDKKDQDGRSQLISIGTGIYLSVIQVYKFFSW